MKKSLKYNLLSFFIVILLTGCGLNIEEINVSESIAEEKDIERNSWLDNSDSVSKEEKYTEYMKEYLQEKLMEIEGVDNIFIDVASMEADKVNVEVIFDDSIQGKEDVMKSMEIALAEFFPEGTVVTVKEK